MSSLSSFSLLPQHTRRQIAATRRSNKFDLVNRRILSKILSPLQNFVAATCRTKSNWFDFVQHFAVTKFCRGDKILINRPRNVEVFTPSDLSLQPIAALSAYDLSLDCTHKAICCSNVLQRFVASCVPTLKHSYMYIPLFHVPVAVIMISSPSEVFFTSAASFAKSFCGLVHSKLTVFPFVASPRRLSTDFNLLGPVVRRPFSSNGG